jgi:nicotinate-nucleotide pyrophosphorylase (carboxylating)
MRRHWAGRATRQENIGHSVKIEVECDTLPQVEQAIAAGVDIILLDNMTPQQMQNAVQKIRDSAEDSG